MSQPCMVQSEPYENKAENFSVLHKMQIMQKIQIDLQI